VSSAAKKLDLGDPPIVKIDTARPGHEEFVRKLAATQNPIWSRFWYIVDKDHPVRKLPANRWRVERLKRVTRLQDPPVAVHAYLELENGHAQTVEDRPADVPLFHSVTDDPVRLTRS